MPGYSNDVKILACDTHHWSSVWPQRTVNLAARFRLSLARCGESTQALNFAANYMLLVKRKTERSNENSEGGRCLTLLVCLLTLSQPVQA